MHTVPHRLLTCSLRLLCGMQGLGGTGQLEGHLKRLAATSQPPGGQRMRMRKPAQETRCIDVFVLLRMLLMEYREEQAARCVPVLTVCRC